MSGDATDTIGPTIAGAQLRLATDEDVPALRRLVNAAYRELAERGLNYTASYQDEDLTRQRMRGASCFVLERADGIVATVTLRMVDTETGRTCGYISQLAVRDDLKGRGVGAALLDFAEARAASLGLDVLRLDTAIPAVHLVALYRRRGYEVVREIRWDGKTYASYLMEKPCPVPVS